MRKNQEEREETEFGGNAGGIGTKKKDNKNKVIWIVIGTVLIALIAIIILNL